VQAFSPSSACGRAGLLLFLVPVLYLLAVLGLQPADRLGDPERWPWLKRLVYDDYDATACALRGLNATLGRTAGRPSPPPALGPMGFQVALDQPLPKQQLEPTYFLEYPHAALLIFRLGYCFREKPAVLPAVCDADYHDLVEHEPRNEGERHWASMLRQAIRVNEVLATACLLILMLVLAAGYQPGVAHHGAAFLLVLPASLYFSVQRFDIIPALLTALSLACLARRRLAASAVLLATATLIKVYPVLLAPLFARYIGAHRRNFWIWTGAYGLVLLSTGMAAVSCNGWDAVLAPYRFQLSRPPEGWTAYGSLLPSYLARPNLVGSVFRIGSVFVLLAVLLWLGPHSWADLLRSCAMVLVLFASLQVFYSPQWLVWLSPFLVPLASTDRALCRAAVAFDVVTYFSFPVVYDLPALPENQTRQALATVCILARFAILALLMIMLARRSRAERRASPEPGLRDRPADDDIDVQI
jgi:hypothetical protein